MLCVVSVGLWCGKDSAICFSTEKEALFRFTLWFPALSLN